MGADEGTPVTDAYKVPFKFTGKIAQVTIELKEMKKADSDDAERARREAAFRMISRSRSSTRSSLSARG